MAVWRVQVVNNVNGNRFTAVRSDKLSETPTSNVCVRMLVQETLRGTWLIRLRHSGDEWVYELRVRHDKALMRWQVESSFSLSSFPLFHFSHILQFLITSLAAGLYFPIRCLQRLSSFFCSIFSSFTYFLWLFPQSLPSPPHPAVRVVDIYSNNPTGHSGGRRCEHTLGKLNNNPIIHDISANIGLPQGWLVIIDRFCVKIVLDGPIWIDDVLILRMSVWRQFTQD